MPFYTSNPLIVSNPQPVRSTLAGTSNPGGYDPLFGRPNWTYVNLLKAPVSGPDPRLAVGTGNSGGTALPGNAAQLPGYLADNAYFPDVFDYSPLAQESNTLPIPKSIHTGNNGRELVGSYEPHDFTPATRFFMQNRSAYNWQVMSYPPSPRQLLRYQLARVYNLQNTVAAARPLPSNNYFLGYQIDPSIQAKIGNSGNGGLSL